MSWRAEKYADEIETTVICQVCGHRVPFIIDEHLQSKDCYGDVRTVEEYKIKYPYADIFPKGVPVKPSKYTQPRRKTYLKGCHIGCNNGGKCLECCYSSDKTITSAKLHCHKRGAIVLWNDESWICYNFDSLKNYTDKLQILAKKSKIENNAKQL